MTIAAYIVLIISQIAGFALIFMVPVGTLIMFLGTLLFAWLTDFAVITPGYLLVIFGVYVLGEAVELVMTVIGAKRFGASNRAAWGAMIGGIFGAVAGSLVFGIGVFPGSVLGIFLGAFFGEWTRPEYWRRSLMAGTGGVIGRLVSVACKLVIALIMLAMVAIRVIPEVLRL